MWNFGLLPMDAIPLDLDWFLGLFFLGIYWYYYNTWYNNKYLKGMEILTYIKRIQQYFNRKNIDIAFVFVMLGIIMSSFITNAWIVSLLACLACLFINDEE